MSEEQRRIGENLSVIRDYLRNHFPDYVLTELEDKRLFQEFSVMNANLGTHYKLKVLWPRLLNPRSTPTTIQAELERENVAGKMVQTPHYIIW